MSKTVFKQNYDPLIAERRRVEMLEHQRQRRLQAQDIQRPVNFSAYIQPQMQRPVWTLQETYGLDVSLQFSEWLAWPPADLSQWLLVPSPRGQRCLVLAHHGRTEMYNKLCKRVCVFRSLLPGAATAQSTLTLLDCIYDAGSDVLFVLDALYFRKMELRYGTAEFRRYCLRGQFEEDTCFAERSVNNEKPFVLVPSYDCANEEQLAAALQRFPHFPNNRPALDGFLFYHKEAQYTCGSTPLVGWLYAFMVPDLLGYEVNAQYERPPDYDTPMQYIAAFDAKLAVRAHKRAKAATNSNQSDATKQTTNLRKRHHICNSTKKHEDDDVDVDDDYDDGDCDSEEEKQNSITLKREIVAQKVLEEEEDAAPVPLDGEVLAD